MVKKLFDVVILTTTTTTKTTTTTTTKSSLKAGSIPRQGRALDSPGVSSVWDVEEDFNNPKTNLAEVKLIFFCQTLKFISDIRKKKKKIGIFSNVVFRKF